MKNYLFTLVLLLLAGPIAAQPSAPYNVLRRVPVGGWDYLTADSQNRRLYVAHSTQIDVLWATYNRRWA